MYKNAVDCPTRNKQRISFELLFPLSLRYYFQMTIKFHKNLVTTHERIMKSNFKTTQIRLNEMKLFFFYCVKFLNKTMQYFSSQLVIFF